MDIDQLKDYITALDALADELDTMADNANPGDQITIAALSDDIRQQILALDTIGLEADAAQLQALQPKVIEVNNQLTAQEKQIKDWANALGDVDTVTQILDKALQVGIGLLK